MSFAPISVHCSIEMYILIYIVYVHCIVQSKVSRILHGLFELAANSIRRNLRRKQPKTSRHWSRPRVANRKCGNNSRLGRRYCGFFYAPSSSYISYKCDVLKQCSELAFVHGGKQYVYILSMAIPATHRLQWRVHTIDTRKSIFIPLRYRYTYIYIHQLYFPY